MQETKKKFLEIKKQKKKEKRMLSSTGVCSLSLKLRRGCVCWGLDLKALLLAAHRKRSR